MQQDQMKRSLTLIPVVLFGFSFMALATVFSTYGIAAELSNGMVSGSYLLALIVMLFTAYSYGQMAKVVPSAGSAYTYTQKSISPHVGFMVGWAVLMDYLFIPMVNYLLFGIFFSAAFPAIPSYIWILGMLLLVTLINARGIRLATMANAMITIFSLLFIFIFIGFSVKEIVGGAGTGTLLNVKPFFNPDESFSYIVAGAALLCFSFLGFDSATAFAEETVNPKKTIPRAVMLITLVGGAVFMTVSYFAYNVWPDHTTFTDPDSASHEIITFVGGKLMATLFLAVYAVTVFGSAMSSQASASRVLFAMGRDGQLPSFFGKLHPKFKTPINNILLISAISLLSLVLSLTLVASFINFGAFIAFISVNIAVISYYFIKKKERSFKGTILYLILPGIGAVLDIWLLLNLDIHSKVLGSIWFALGFIYLIFLTKGFKQKPPELHLSLENDSQDRTA
ncbi:amino acid transporter [Bacillus thermophilus]|uniref:Amino acid transporter n=1 Tax=Siminovitchia thermophila TaxID=1245522 RepID=A0ABS2R5Y6_9BACI|nr:amino acid permease [Siminovitchia thermophila]MBM7714313.1 amino acid transporter [Siminovitchia thermophila]ONK22213.1 Putrescine importer PuuP [Bacillus sp. VT-16-64]